MKEVNIFCGGITPSKTSQKSKTLELDVQDKGEKKKNVELKIESISKAVFKNIPDEVLDLLEIGAYVYCADQHVRRGSEKLTDFGEDWRRSMNFNIPVRNVELWNQEHLKEALKDTLGFLAGETYNFNFVQAENPLMQKDSYFGFIDDPLTPDDVALFSGGIDSFAGAVETVIGRKRKVALVGHHSSNNVKNVQTKLIEELKRKGFENQIQHISIEVRNSNNTASEYTQRTRSFLFACLAMSIAHMYGKDEFTFFENGVISLNIPITKDVLESRATRTTHPRVINGLQHIFSIVFNKDVNVKHPYQWLTKAEVTKKISDYGCEDMISSTSSCTRTAHILKKGKTHCASCSQCIDRRFGVLAAGLGEYDCAEGYTIDLLTGYRDSKKDVSLAAHYVKFAQEFSTLTKEKLLSQHPAVASALDEFPGITTLEVKNKIFDLYKRHSEGVLQVMREGLEENISCLTSGDLPSTCLLSLMFNRTKIIEEKPSNYTKELEQTLDKLQKQSCYFYFDEQNERVLFKGDYEITGASFNLIKALIENFRKGKMSSKEIECIPAGKLSSILTIDEASLRTQIRRLRKEISEKLGIDQGIVFDTDGFIENIKAKGYRLNKQLKELPTPSDLED